MSKFYRTSIYLLLTLLLATSSGLAGQKTDKLEVTGPATITGYLNIGSTRHITTTAELTAAAAVSTIGEIIIGGIVEPAADLDLSAKAVTIPRGGKIKPASGKTVTLPPPKAGAYQIFDLSSGGLVVISESSDILAEWWGTGATDTIIRAAIVASPAQSRVVLTASSYAVSTELAPKNDITLTSLNRSTLTRTTAGNVINSTAKVTNFTLENVKLVGTADDINLFQLVTLTDANKHENVTIRNCELTIAGPGTCIHIGRTFGRVVIEDNILTGSVDATSDPAVDWLDLELLIRLSVSSGDESITDYAGDTLSGLVSIVRNKFVGGSIGYITLVADYDSGSKGMLNPFEFANNELRGQTKGGMMCYHHGNAHKNDIHHNIFDRITAREHSNNDGGAVWLDESASFTKNHLSNIVGNGVYAEDSAGSINITDNKFNSIIARTAQTYSVDVDWGGGGVTLTSDGGNAILLTHGKGYVVEGNSFVSCPNPITLYPELMAYATLAELASKYLRFSSISRNRFEKYPKIKLHNLCEYIDLSGNQFESAAVESSTDGFIHLSQDFADIYPQFLQIHNNSGWLRSRMFVKKDFSGQKLVANISGNMINASYAITNTTGWIDTDTFDDVILGPNYFANNEGKALEYKPFTIRALLDDDASLNLPSSCTGYARLTVGESEQYANFNWRSIDTYTALIDASSSVVAIDTDDKVCILNSGTQAYIKNRLGAQKIFYVQGWYK